MDLLSFVAFVYKLVSSQIQLLLEDLVMFHQVASQNYMQPFWNSSSSVDNENSMQYVNRFYIFALVCHSGI